MIQSFKEKIIFYLSALLYLVFNFRLGVDVAASIEATLWQVLQTAPFVSGVTYVIITLLQHTAGGEKVPWNRRLRLFFAIGILAGLIYAIYEYAGVGTALRG